MKATTPDGSLRELEDCWIEVPPSAGGKQINMRILPEISDSKSAAYNDEPIIGRSFPLKTYSHSENRSISWTAHFIVCKSADIGRNLEELRMLEACVYPKNDGISPYEPPPVCKLYCGELLGMTPLCAVLKSYSVKFPTDVAWDDTGYLPYKFDVDMTWEVVYDSQDLPGAERIMGEGR